MPNPSTLQADTEQRYHYHHALANNLHLGKTDREHHLRIARNLAEELGIDGPEAINGRPAEDAELTYTSRSFNAADWQLIADAVSNSDIDGDTRIRLLDRLQ